MKQLMIPGMLIAAAGILSAGLNRPPSANHDGQHDFDFDFGTWKSNITRLRHPLSGSTPEWVKIEATVTVRKVWDGLANLEELEADTPSGRLEFLGLRLYNPESRQWTIQAGGSSDGTLSPMKGEFRNGRGEFISQESVNGRTVLVRQVWSNITPNSHHFEQAYSDDGGKTWEPNFIATLTRRQPVEAASRPNASQPHEFDFNEGSWKVHISRLEHPLAPGSKPTWTNADGTAQVSKVWDGRAYLEELEAGEGQTRIKGLALRLYNPEAKQWNLYWANAKDGELDAPMTGGFKDGHGEFHDQEAFKGRTVLAREVWSDITADSCRFVQAFSDDGGKTWESNWISEWTRIK